MEDKRKQFFINIVSELVREGIRISSEDINYIYSRYLSGRTEKQIISDFKLKTLKRKLEEDICQELKV